MARIGITEAQARKLGWIIQRRSDGGWYAYQAAAPWGGVGAATKAELLYEIKLTELEEPAENPIESIQELVASFPRAKGYYNDGIGHIGVMHQGWIQWFEWDPTQGYILSGTTRTPEGAPYRRV